jgi:hypothetical protein
MLKCDKPLFIIIYLLFNIQSNFNSNYLRHSRYEEKQTRCEFIIRVVSIINKYAIRPDLMYLSTILVSA